MSTESYSVNPYLNLSDDKFDTDTKYVKNLILDYVKKITENVSPVDSKGRFGHLHSGDAGLAFMFWKLSQSNYLKSEADYLAKARQYSQTAKRQIEKVSESCSSFLFGRSGVNAVALVIANELNDQHEYKLSLEKILNDLEECADPDYSEEEACDEYCNGRAGFLCGMHWINHNIKQVPITDEQIRKVSQAILENGQRYAEDNNLPCPLMYSYYMGAAHGVSSPYLALLQTPWNNDVLNSNLKDIRESIDYLVQHQDKDGHFAISFTGAEEDSGEERMIRFTHGAPGIIYLLIKSYLVYKDEKYLVAAKKSADAIWEKGLIENGTWIFEGIIGNAYSFLAMYRLTLDRQYLYRAFKFLEFTQSDDYLSKITDESFTLYEGISGIVCFLVDLLEPEKSYFPFMNVF